MNAEWLGLKVEPGFIRVPFKLFGKILFWRTKRIWRLTEDYVERVCGKVVRIPRGFEFDGASIPLLARALLSATEALVASCGHDWRYAGNEDCTRLEADECFYEVMMDVCQVPPWRARVGYVGVRWFGSFSWGDTKV